MIGILVVTHGRLGKEFIESSELIIGNQPSVNALGLFHGDGIEEFNNTVRDNILKLDDGQGVLVLTDIFGGSPSNVTALNIKGMGDKVNLRCITGVNMPMFIEACMMRGSLELNELVNHCCSAAKDGIKNMDE